MLFICYLRILGKGIYEFGRLMSIDGMLSAKTRVKKIALKKFKKPLSSKGQ
jgi:hypothetical protein